MSKTSSDNLDVKESDNLSNTLVNNSWVEGEAQEGHITDSLGEGEHKEGSPDDSRVKGQALVLIPLFNPVELKAINAIQKENKRVDKEICPVHILVDGTRHRIRLPQANKAVLRDHFLLRYTVGHKLN